MTAAELQTAAMIGIREVQRIQRERAECKLWNQRPGAKQRQNGLTEAVKALSVLEYITYFETTGTPTSTNQ